MADLAYASNEALLLVIVLSAAPVVVATLVGLVIGLFQTVTQLQEQTLPFGLKMLAVFGSLLLLSGWLSTKMLVFAVEMVQLGLK
ncbi:type III secretion system export apparatus subunit SctS [Pandoraea pulmonicola]|uniref:EscS/YscS/HrcS family type III secretion system export apparatus protein n=1 Tax=Pandoraea pulmonicola TaxID=93221 RepID=A0AAJ4ZHZ3_PANPU|nr:type III secretion system export apparatus subunit SctS [Pandoraea pulmonicola]AJC22361.1 EscS/YscS/HrcS family type III secretion system export apparatus protein [Pandoraea pulmonicola]SUD95599.1 Flagellar biosynthetic protein FliQ [Pandoraea pulmonicola]